MGYNSYICYNLDVRVEKAQEISKKIIEKSHYRVFWNFEEAKKLYPGRNFKMLPEISTFTNTGTVRRNLYAKFEKKP